MDWCRQTEDRIIDGLTVSKSRLFYEPNILPSANLIKSVGIGSSSVYMSNVQPFFNPANENDQTVAFQNKVNFINQDAKLPAFASANVSGLGTVGCGAITSSGNLSVTGTINGWY